MGFALASIGFLYIFRNSYRRMAIIFIIGGIIESLIAAKITAYLSPVGFQYWPAIDINPITIISQYFNNSEKRTVWLYTLTSFGGLAIFSPGAMLAVIFDLFQYFATGDGFNQMWTPFKHHRAILAPFMGYGVIEVCAFMSKYIKIKYLAVWIFIATCVFQFIFHYPLNKLTKTIYWRNEPWMDNLNQLIKTIPSSVSLASQQNLVPHVSHRRDIYLVYPRKHDFSDMPCGEISCWWLDFDAKADYLLVDMRPNQWLTQTLETNENYQSAIANMEKRGFIKVERKIGDATLYKVVH